MLALGQHCDQATERAGEAGRPARQDGDPAMSSDADAWRDLVARLELPSHADPDATPWPDRENIGPSPADQESAQASQGQAAGGQAQAPGRGIGTPDQRPAASRRPPDRSRVIRPASFLPFAEPQPAPVDPPPGPATAQPHEHDGPSCAAEPGSLESELDAEFPGFADGLEDPYIPPPVPALPRLDPIARGAWTALFGGPGYLFAATLLDWQVPGWAELLAIVAFIAGFTVLVFRLGDGPSRRDGPDQGAVV